MDGLASRLMAFEADELNARAELELFSELVKTGIAWQLQGVYGRTAVHLIDSGYLYEDGNISSYAEDVLADLEAEYPYQDVDEAAREV